MNKPIEATPLHSLAKGQVTALVIRFAEQLILQSKIIASSDGASIVLDNHVNDAHKLVAKRSETNRARDIVLIIGSTCLGAFLQGFIEAALNTNITRVVIWAVVGIIGTSLTMFGLWGMR
jgi:hypothetical protein